jgi:hypothetical protein
MLVLPEYYNSSKELEYKTSKKSSTSNTKRQKWLKDKNNENPTDKTIKHITRSTNTVKKNDKSRKKAKEHTTIKLNVNDNDKEDKRTKTHQIQQIDNNSDILNNPYISNKQVFLNWYNKSYHKTKIKIPTKTTTVTTNYFDCLDCESELQDNSPLENTETMPLLPQKKYSAPVFESTKNIDEYTTYDTEKNEQEWTPVNEKEIKNEMKNTTEYLSHYYLPRYLPQTTSTTDSIGSTSIVIPLSIKMLPKKEHREKKF